MSDLKKIILVKDYPIRHDIIIKSGSEIEVGPNRELQLIQAGFAEGDIDPEVIETHKAKANRKQKEDKPQIVEHKITE